jgi:hypothetical protein
MGIRLVRTEPLASAPGRAYTSVTRSSFRAWTRLREASRSRSDEEFAMSQTDITYFTRRTAESHAARIAAVDDGARLAHKQLETAYTALVLSSERDAAAPPADFTPAAGPFRAKDALFAWDDKGDAAT